MFVVWSSCLLELENPAKWYFCTRFINLAQDAQLYPALLWMLANLADSQPQSKELDLATHVLSKMISIPPGWSGQGPLFTVCLGMCLIWRTRKVKKHPQKMNYMWDECRAASFLFCFMCSRFHFRFLCVCILCSLYVQPKAELLRQDYLGPRTGVRSVNKVVSS